MKVFGTVGGLFALVVAALQVLIAFNKISMSGGPFVKSPNRSFRIANAAWIATVGLCILAVTWFFGSRA